MGSGSMDIVDKATRSRMMSGIRGKNTKPEMVVRRALFAAGLRYRLHRKDLPGTPDIVLPGRRVVIFVNGCFWHQHAGCRLAKLPRTNRQFWKRKLNKNVQRDHEAAEQLLAQGWRVLTVWECAIKEKTIRQTLGERLSSWISGDELSGEIRASAK